jgi:hypothetical protein
VEAPAGVMIDDLLWLTEALLAGRQQTAVEIGIEI